MYGLLRKVERPEMDDTYAINVAKSEYREGFSTGDVDRISRVFADEFTDMSDSRPNRYAADAPAKLRAYLEELFSAYQAHLNVIIIQIVVLGDTAYDYGWHELTLIPKSGGEPVSKRTRYLELWRKAPAGAWRITRFMDNADIPDMV
jgi:ketosteroid isomerase-like protein